MRKDVRGIAGLTLLLVVLLVAAVAYAGYVVFYQEDSEVVDTGDSSSVQRQTETDNEPVESAQDIEEELSEIESVDLESELDTSGLDEDLNAL